MPRPSYVLLQKKEWDQLKKKSLKKDELKPRDEHITELVKKSQPKIKTWPNSVEGCVKRLEDQRENRRKQNKALIKAFSEKLSKDNTSNEIKKARQLIFNNSCYGKQLCGSLIASKVMEERDAQVIFNKELKLKLLQLEKEQQKHNTLPALNIDEDLKQNQKRLAALEIVKQNKEMEAKKIEMERKLKEDDVKCNKIDAEFIKNITDQETQHMLKAKRMHKQAIEEFNEERKKYYKIKEARNQLDDALTETYRKEKCRIKDKIDKVNKKIVTDTQNDGSKSKQVFKTIEKLQNQKNKAYEDFVEKGVKVLEERQKADEQQRIEKLNQNRQKRVMIEKSFKFTPEKDKPKYCERSSINLKSTKVKQKGPQKIQTEYEFKEPKVSLLEGLKRREKEKSPWNGTKASHEQFAEQAATVFKECKHKQFVKKIIDDYRRLNHLDTKTLPIPDY